MTSRLSLRGEKKVIDKLVAQVRDSDSDIQLPAASTTVKGKSLDAAMKAAVQNTLRIFKLKNSSNAELRIKIGNVSKDLGTLKTKVDGHDKSIADANKKAQEALDEITKIKEKLSQVDIELDTLDEAIKKKVAVDLNEEQMTSIKQEVWKLVASDNAKQRTAKHNLNPHRMIGG